MKLLYFWLGTKNHSSKGYTLLELLIVLVLIGILSAIAVGNWLVFFNLQRLDTAQDQVYRIMREAQSNAKRDKITWQVSFQENNDVVRWAIHPKDSIPTLRSWHNLEPYISIDDPETSLYKSNGIWRVQFNFHGNTNGQLGRITLISNYTGRTKRCVFVSTLIGNLRKAKENRTQDSTGRYCY